MKLRNVLQPKWMIVVVGTESGSRSPLPFMRFWKRTSADLAAARMNDRRDNYLTRFEVDPWEK